MFRLRFQLDELRTISSQKVRVKVHGEKLKTDYKSRERERKREREREREEHRGRERNRERE